jgi:hypothetical protein
MDRCPSRDKPSHDAHLFISNDLSYDISTVKRALQQKYRVLDAEAMRGARGGYFTASMTRATLPKISATSLSVAISGGVSAMVSPVTRMTKPSSWKAFSIAE